MRAGGRAPEAGHDGRSGRGLTSSPLYHRLHPLYSRLPFPATSLFQVEKWGDVTAIRMARLYFGKALLPVLCFAVGDTLIDTGLSCMGGKVLAFAKANGIRRALVTHHHEDHAGNAGLLARNGIEVFTGPLGTRLVAEGFPILFYQHLLWGKVDPGPSTPLGAETPLGARTARVLPAAGHSHDQVVFFVPEEGWLFSGDAFLHERVKVFRRDEDFASSVATLERLTALDFDSLLCAHRPRRTKGREALREKLGWLREVEGRVRALHATGAGVGEITRRLAIKGSAGAYALTLGDVSTANLVRSILVGPVARPETASGISSATPSTGATG